MATIPRTGPLPAPANIASTRGGPSTRVSSVGGSSVEDLHGSSGVSFDSAAFGFRGGTDANFDRGPGTGNGDGNQPQHSGYVDAPSQAFAAMVEGAEFPKTDDEQSRPGFVGSVPAGLAAKAIEIYETNARILSGEAAIRGTSFSVVL